MPTSWSITPAQYAEALACLLKSRAKKIKNGFAMLKANYRAEGRVITATKLAKAAGYDNHGTGNEQYGSFAHELCKLLDFEPEQQRNGKPVWTYLICEPSIEKDTHGHFQWFLRDEVARALEQLGVVRPTRVGNVLQEVCRVVVRGEIGVRPSRSEFLSRGHSPDVSVPSAVSDLQRSARPHPVDVCSTTCDTSNDKRRNNPPW